MQDSTQESKINEISCDIKGFLSREAERITRINQLEEKLHKMQNYVSRPDTPNMDHMDEIKAFNSFLRTGTYGELVTKSFSGEQGEGGVLITPSISQKIIARLSQKSIMRQVASIENISTRSLEILYEKGDFSAGWAAETQDRNITNTPKLEKKSIYLHEIYAQPKATQSFIDDVELDLANWLAGRIADSFIALENEAFILGDGNNKPKGLLLNDQVQRVNSGSNITVESLLNLINSLDEGYLGGASFIMNRRTLSLIQGLKDVEGRFIWSQSMSGSLQHTIFGIPVFTSQHMPNIEDAKPSIILGDFKLAYKIVDSGEISMMRDPYTDKPFIKFYAVKRVGGDVVDPHAMKFAVFST